MHIFFRKHVFIAFLILQGFNAFGSNNIYPNNFEVFIFIDSTARYNLTEIINTDLRWRPHSVKNFTPSPSDQHVVWFKIAILTDKKEQKILVTPAFTKSLFYKLNLNSCNEVYNGGILNATKETKIRPDYEEQIIVHLDSGMNTYFLKAKYNLVRFNPLFFDVVDMQSKDKIITLYQSGRKSDVIFQYIFFGILVFQLLFIFIQWLFIRLKEYLYYSIYIFVIGMFFLSKAEFLMQFNFFYGSHPANFIYFDNFFSWFSAFIYFRFARAFVNLPIRDPLLNRRVILLEYIILGYAFISILLAVFTELYVLKESIYLIFSSTITIITLAIIYRFIKRNEILYNFAISGSLLITLGSFLSIIAYQKGVVEIGSISLHPIVIFQGSVILELLCFTTGLAYKSRIDAREKIDSQMELINKMTENDQLQKKLTHIRDDIAHDLHDEVGSTLSSISLYSKAMENSLLREDYQKLKFYIKEVGQSSRNTMDNMKEIIWTMSSVNDEMIKLIERMESHATIVLTASGINNIFRFNETLKQIVIPVDVRKNLMLLFKEIINNISKHSEAKNVEILFEIDVDKMHLLIRDDGCGFDPDKVNNGNGMHTMYKRANDMHGILEIRTRIEQGTSVSFRNTLS